MRINTQKIRGKSTAVKMLHKEILRYFKAKQMEGDSTGFYRVISASAVQALEQGGIKRGTLRSFLQGNIEPNAKTLQQIARVFARISGGSKDWKRVAELLLLPGVDDDTIIDALMSLPAERRITIAEAIRETA